MTTTMEKVIILFLCIAFAPGNFGSVLRDRIAVGPDTEKTAPFVAILNGIGEAKCYGVLISKQAVLTTEKCAEFCKSNIVTCKIHFSTGGDREYDVKTVVKHHDVKLAILITDGSNGQGIAIKDDVLADNLNVTVAGLTTENTVSVLKIIF